MLRVAFSILLAALLVATGAASAAHGLMHEAPHGDHGAAMHGDDHSAVALAECCDAPGAQAGGGCMMDAACLGPLVVGPTAMGERPIAFRRSLLASGISAAVPTGPPKV